MDNFYNTGQIAETLSISLDTVYGLIKSGKLRAIKIGKDYRIADSALSAYIEASTVTQPKPFLLPIGRKPSRSSEKAAPVTPHKFTMEEVFGT